MSPGEIIQVSLMEISYVLRKVAKGKVTLFQAMLPHFQQQAEASAFLKAWGNVGNGLGGDQTWASGAVTYQVSILKGCVDFLSPTLPGSCPPPGVPQFHRRLPACLLVQL